jgi:hypothetical protein
LEFEIWNLELRLRRAVRSGVDLFFTKISAETVNECVGQRHS